MHNDHEEYLVFCSKLQIEKSVNVLLGIIEGICADSIINSKELAYLNQWLTDNRKFRFKHPYNELYPAIENALADGVLTEEEKQDLLWLCNRLLSSNFFDEVSADIQRLHGILGGIASDGVINFDEISLLNNWINENDHLKGRWPYDEVESLIMSSIKSKSISESTHKTLIEFFSEFVAILDDKTITNPKIIINNTVKGVCSSCPEIIFKESVFCFTGASSRYTRTQIQKVVLDCGGFFSNLVTKKVKYLVIGSEGNPCWAYACYGRKVEKAIEIRKAGGSLQIIHENDFHDAVLDLH